MALLSNFLNKKHFKNLLCLNYKNPVIEASYKDSVYGQLPKRVLFFSIGILVLGIGLLIAIIVISANLEKTSEKKAQLDTEIINSYAVLSVVFVNMVLCLIAKFKNCIVKFSHLMNYLSLCLLFDECLAFGLINLDEFYTDLILKIEISVKVIYILLIECNFTIIALSSLIAIAHSLIAAYSLNIIKNIHIFSSLIAYIVIILLSKLSEQIYKVIFYYKYKISKKSAWLKSTLNSISNGLVVVDMEHVLYFNDYVAKNLKFLVQKRQHLINGKSKSSFTSISGKDVSVEVNDNHSKVPVKYNSSSKFSLKCKNTLKYAVTAKWSSQNKIKEYIDDTKTNSSVAKFTESIACQLASNQFIAEKGDNDLMLNSKVFIGLESINPEIDEDVILCISNPESDVEDVLQSIENSNKEHKHFQDFTFIGIKTFRCRDNSFNDENISVLEIFLRIVENEGKGVAFELLFNDITRSALTEETKAQMKFKTIFLSKVSHEFKNPLIMIKELSDQVCDDLDQVKRCSKDNLKYNDTSQLINDKLRLLKNLSNYLLILVKDFEVVSKRECKSGIDIVKNDLDIREELSMIQQIVEALIYKKHGSVEYSPVKFCVNILPEVPKYLCTDKVRLHQILINLLSNSIKFTQDGIINLNVSLDTLGRIKFQVTDTGKGIKPNEEKTLFKEFDKGEEMNNIYGSGLGLTIVKELCFLLGSEIHFARNEPVGSIFYFSLSPKEEPEKWKREERNTISLTNLKELRLEDMDETILVNDLRTAICNNNRFSRSNILEESNSKQSRKAKTSRKRNEAIPIDKFEGIALIKDYSSRSSQTPGENNLQTLKSFQTNIFLQNTQLYSNPMIIEQKYIMSNFLNQELVSCHVEGWEIIHKPEDAANGSSFCYPKFVKIYSHKGEGNANANVNVNVTSFQVSGEVSFKWGKDKKLAIIVTDDDTLVRQSIIRVIDKFFNRLNIKLEATIIETKDGIECLHAVYLSILQRIHVDLIITDETMNYMSGSFSLEILSRMTTNNILPYKIPVCIVSAYEENFANTSKYNYANLSGVFSKPVSLTTLENIFKQAKIL